MGSIIDAILGKEGATSSNKNKKNGEYHIMLGRCTKRAYDVAHGRVDTYLPGRFKSKVKMVRCTKCGLIDCVTRDSVDEEFPEHTKCVECGGKTEWVFK